jgi:hypothetical protein
VVVLATLSDTFLAKAKDVSMNMIIFSEYLCCCTSMRETLFKVGLVLFVVYIYDLYFCSNMRFSNHINFSKLWRMIKIIESNHSIANNWSMYFMNETTNSMQEWNNYTNHLSIENNRLTNDTKGAVLWTQFGGGLTNQRLRLKSAIYLAAILKRPIILSSWILSREKFIVKWDTVPWKKISTSKVYNTPFLIVCLGKLGIKAFYPCLPNTCLPGFTPPRITNAAISRGHSISLPFVVGSSDPLFLELPFREATFRHAIDSCITWSPDVQNFGQKMIQYITKLSGNNDLSNVFGLHLRVEDDFSAYIATLYSGWKGNATTVSRSIENEIINGALNCFDKHLKHVKFSKSWIYIATGVPINSSRFINLTKYFSHIITKENMTLDFIEFGMDFIGAVDSYVLEQLSFFVGFSESTFATQVAENRRRKNLSSALYTIKPANNCPQFDIWNKW